MERLKCPETREKIATDTTFAYTESLKSADDTVVRPDRC